MGAARALFAEREERLDHLAGRPSWLACSDALLSTQVACKTGACADGLGFRPPPPLERITDFFPALGFLVLREKTRASLLPCLEK